MVLKMATWSSRTNLVKARAEILKNYNKKPTYKIDPLGKLQIINALDNGQCKSDVAKEYGVHPQTIGYIYKQKELIIKKYASKYNLMEARSLNLDQSLLDWFQNEIKVGNIVHEVQLKLKAQDVINALKEKFNCLDEWLSDFLIRHNIVKHNIHIESSPQMKEKWMNIVNGPNFQDIYFGGFCALSHRLDFNSYICNHKVESYVSLLFIVNTTGLDKHKVTVIGNEPLHTNSNIKSLPLDYYYDSNPQINYFILEKYLRMWDEELSVKRKNVTLYLNIPSDIINQLNLKNIELLIFSNEDYVAKVSDKLSQCFKYHYRRIHISQNNNLVQRDYSPTMVEYLHMISRAWHNVSHKYIHRICLPPSDGTLSFKTDEDEDYGDLSLAQWCKLSEIPVDTELYSESLEKYVMNDNELPFQNWTNFSGNTVYMNEILIQRHSPTTSAMEAFQAMKRLVSYLQGENANMQIIEFAKFLEDHLEYGALLQMHELTAAEANETIE